MSKIPWIMKYRPKKIDDVVNQEEAKKSLIEWVNEWLRGVPKERGALLYGPPGCGKTSLVEALANDFKFELVEMNASDYRRRADLERIARVAALQRGILGRGKIILLDEVDGISGVADLGALDTILEILKVTKNPVIMTANDPWDPKLRSLRESVRLVGFKRLTKTDVRKVLQKICASEKLICEEDAIDFIAERSEGDLRSAINDLEAVAEGYGKVTLELAKNILRARDRVYEPFEVVRKIFISKYAWQAKQAAQQTDLTPDELIQWINENLPRQITDPEDLWRAYDALSKADVYLGRVVRSGSWDLLPYAIELMTSGVSLSIVNDVKSKFRWVKYSFPQRILLMARTKEVRQIRDDLAEVIARHLHISKATAKTDVIPYLKVIFDTNADVAAKIAIGLNLSDNMIRYLTPHNASKVIENVNKIRDQMREAVKEEGRELQEVRRGASRKGRGGKGLDMFTKR